MNSSFAFLVLFTLLSCCASKLELNNNNNNNILNYKIPVFFNNVCAMLSSFVKNLQGKGQLDVVDDDDVIRSPTTA